MKINILALFIYCSSVVFSQDLESLDNKFREYNTEETKSYGWVKEHVMVDLKINILGEIFSPQDKDVEFYKVSDYFENDTARFIDRNLLINLFGVGLEPRVSLYEKEDFTVGLKTSLHFNLSLYTNYDNWYKSTGVFHLNSSAMAYYARGLSSSFSNTSENGFSIAAGMLFIKAPLLGGKAIYEEDEIVMTPRSEEFLIDSWLIPAVQFDYYFLTQEFKMRNFSLAFSHFKGNTYFRFNYGFTF